MRTSGATSRQRRSLPPLDFSWERTGRRARRSLRVSDHGEVARGLHLLIGCVKLANKSHVNLFLRLTCNFVTAVAFSLR